MCEFHGWESIVADDSDDAEPIGAIIQHQYVLVRAGDATITGIVTTTDLSFQFQQLAEPFLLLGEIENHIRRVIGGKFTAAELKVVRDPGDQEREVTSVADLTFGEYVKLLENPQYWDRISLGVDRTTFVKELDKMRVIRNDVMHFDPDGISDDARRPFVARRVTAKPEIGRRFRAASSVCAIRDVASQLWRCMQRWQAFDRGSTRGGCGRV